MPTTQYDFTKVAALDRLTKEIQESAIVTALDYMNLEGSDDLSIYFKDELSSGDETILEGLVDNHEAIPLADNPKEVTVVSSITPPPFAAKTLPNGKKLFRRKHGVSETIPAGETGTISLVVPYSLAKINKMEITNCKSGDTVDLKVYDNSSGTISGVPNYMLNQFGFAVRMPDNFYVDESNYDADLILGMKVEITYTNNGEEAREVGMNVTLHQLV